MLKTRTNLSNRQLCSIRMFASNSIVVFFLVCAPFRVVHVASASPPHKRASTESTLVIREDCYEHLLNGETTSGVYTIQPAGSEPFSVYCDQETLGGGWTVFQRREYGLVNFYNDWAAYKEGFGDPNGSYWLGNEKLFYLTNQHSYNLRVDLTDFEGEKRYAEYNKFAVGDESSNYRLAIQGYSGDAGDAMSDSDGNDFSTYDRDNDIWHKSCAQTYKGGWWYGKCHHANLNGLYVKGEHETYADGINWEQWHGYYYSLKSTEMKLRPAGVVIPNLPLTRDCYELKERGETTSGLYIIQPDESKPFEVYCDMETDGGGWTVFQRRQDGSVGFYRDWADYKEGFGDPEGEFWLGNDNLFHLSNQKIYHLRVDLGDFENKKYATYDKFVIANEANKYQLEIGRHSGDMPDVMMYNNKRHFSTKDQDNDNSQSSCSALSKGAWWYNECTLTDLNAPYPDGPGSGFFWFGVTLDLKFAEMKLRPGSVG